MSLLLLTYQVGLLLTLFAVLMILYGCLSKRGRAAFEKQPYWRLGFLALVAAFWFAPWERPLGYLGAKFDSDHRFFLNRPAFSAREYKARDAYTRILQDRYGIFCARSSGCLVFSSRDAGFNNAYDEVMRAAILQHYGRDVLAECEQAAREETGTPAS